MFFYSGGSRLRRWHRPSFKTVLLYGGECWRVTKSDMKALASFHMYASDKPAESFGHVESLTGNYLSWQIFLYYQWNYGRDTSDVFKIDLRWTPQRNRPRERTEITWRTAIEAELGEIGIACGEAEAKAKDRVNSNK